MVKPGHDSGHAHVPSIQSGGPDVIRNIPPHVDPNMWRPNPGSYPHRRPNVHTPPGQFSPSWCPQQVFGPGDNVNMHRGIGPGPFFRPVPTPIYGAAPGFIYGPSFPGNSVYLFSSIILDICSHY